MKLRRRYVFFLLLLLFSVKSYSQSIKSFDDLSTSVGGILDRFGTANAVTFMSTRDMSTGYIGAFPSFGIGVKGALGVSGVDMFKLFASDVKNALADIPTVGITFPVVNIKVGGFKIKQLSMPFDLGFSIGGFPSSLFDFSFINLDELKIGYIVVGLDMRLAVFQDQRILPGLSLGLGYGFSQATAAIPINLGDFISTNEFTSAGDILKIDNADLDIKSGANTVSLKIQGHKNLYFWEPYIGIEPALTIVSSETKLSTDNFYVLEGLNYVRVNNLDKYIPESIGNIETDEDGIKISSTNVKFLTRFYFGSSLRISSVYIESAFGYEPFSRTTEANLGLRYKF